MYRLSHEGRGDISFIARETISYFMYFFVCQIKPVDILDTSVNTSILYERYFSRLNLVYFFVQEVQDFSSKPLSKIQTSKLRPLPNFAQVYHTNIKYTS